MLLAVYGDSLSLPRNVLGVSREDTYSELLLRHFHVTHHNAVLYNRSLAGIPIAGIHKQFLSDIWYFGRSTPSFCVIQVGIVDCAPRPVTGKTKAIISRLPSVLRVPVIAAIHALRPALINHGFYSQETPPDMFRETLTSFVKAAADAFDQVVVVNICPNHPDIESRTPKMPECIAEYNGLIAEVVTDIAADSVQLADVYSAIRSAGLDGSVNPKDGHHITAAGHRVYADTIKSILRASV